MSKELTFMPNPHIKSDTAFVIRPAGWLAEFAQVDVGVQRCGHIHDGIGLDLSDGEKPAKGSWYPGGVISFADLEAIYFAAKAHRSAQATLTLRKGLNEK